MKVKVKGLVFAGFAAMIFAANAMAADNTVTSKEYVDNKFQAISDKAQDLTATGETAAAKYPSVAAVKTALDNIPGAEAYTGTGLIDVTGHEISTTAQVNVLEGVQVAGVDQTIDANKKVNLGAAAGKGADTTITSSATDSNVPTSKAVYDYVGAQPGAEAYTGTGLIDVTGHEISTTAQVNVLEGVQVAGVDQTIDANKKVNLGAAAGKAVDTSITAGSTSTDVPTTAAVAAYVANQPGAEAYTGTGLIDVTGHEISTTAQVNVLEGVQVAGVDQTIDANKKVNLGAAAGKGADTTITSSATDSNVPTSKAVYDYVDALPAADIPAMPTQAEDPDGYCDASHPCALVTDETSGKPVWKRIAQQGD